MSTRRDARRNNDRAQVSVPAARVECYRVRVCVYGTAAYTHKSYVLCRYTNAMLDIGVYNVCILHRVKGVHTSVCRFSIECLLSI